MSARIVQINFKYNVSAAEYGEAGASLVDQFAELSGLRWKVWFINEEENEAGGFYVFDDAASAQSFLEGPLAATVVSHPALSDFSVKQFDVMDNLTAITRGPVETGASA